MNRRAFIALVTGAAAGQASAQQTPKTRRIGVLWHAANEQEEAAFIGPLRQGFAELGYVEGTHFVLENRYPAEQPELFERFARELAALRVDVLVAISPPAANAAKRATSTIPIVFCPVPDPVALGLVSSFSRPGGNAHCLTKNVTEQADRQDWGWCAESDRCRRWWDRSAWAHGARLR